SEVSSIILENFGQQVIFCLFDAKVFSSWNIIKAFPIMFRGWSCLANKETPAKNKNDRKFKNER
ncbi:MAG: hypothetical protein ABI169_11305, partial [Chitinophagaceae bacterium]